MHIRSSVLDRELPDMKTILSGAPMRTVQAKSGVLQISNMRCVRAPPMTSGEPQDSLSSNHTNSKIIAHSIVWSDFQSWWWRLPSATANVVILVCGFRLSTHQYSLTKDEDVPSNPGKLPDVLLGVTRHVA